MHVVSNLFSKNKCSDDKNEKSLCFKILETLLNIQNGGAKVGHKKIFKIVTTLTDFDHICIKFYGLLSFSL